MTMDKLVRTMRVTRVEVDNPKLWRNGGHFSTTRGEHVVDESDGRRLDATSGGSRMSLSPVVTPFSCGGAR